MIAEFKGFFTECFLCDTEQFLCHPSERPAEQQVMPPLTGQERLELGGHKEARSCVSADANSCLCSEQQVLFRCSNAFQQPCAQRQAKCEEIPAFLCVCVKKEKVFQES